MLVLENITKLYEQNRGIKDVNLRMAEGEIVCLVGPNGVGKTTLINIVAGLDQSFRGSSKLNDKDTWLIESKFEIGYMPQLGEQYASLKLREFIGFVSEIKGTSETKMNDLLKRYDLYDYMEKPIKTFSYGMKQKVNLLVALNGESKLVVLDEPTNGLDTKSIIYLKEDLLKMRENDKIILISSHNLDFVSQIGTYFCFLKDGELIYTSIETNIQILEKIYKEQYNI